MNELMQRDFDYLAQQSEGNINLAISGMLALMQDTDAKYEAMKSQNWFMRMINTVMGKNKATLQEIKQNHEKLSQYVCMAVSNLYDRGCVHEDMILSLGNQFNEFYMDHIQLKQQMGAFAAKLNEKIEESTMNLNQQMAKFAMKLNEKIDSIDNYHMLIQKIDHGMFAQDQPIVAVCKIVSQLDRRALEDYNKLALIKKAMKDQNIINDEQVPLFEHMKGMIQIPIDEAGQIHLEVSGLKDSYMAVILQEMIESYYYLPDMARKMKNKDLLIKNVLYQEQLDETVSISTNDIYEDLVKSKIEVSETYGNMLIQRESFFAEKSNSMQAGQTVNIESDEITHAEELFLNCKFDQAFELFSKLAEQGNPRAMYFMGAFYELPFGHVKQNMIEADRFYEKGAKAGDGLCVLGCLNFVYEDLKEIVEDVDSIAERIKSQAYNGDVFVQYEIGCMYYWGEAVQEDENKAFQWWLKSANGGLFRAMNRVGSCYFHGNGVQENEQEAMRWYQMGIDKGSPRSYRNMAMFIEKDQDRALELYKKAYNMGLLEVVNYIGDVYDLKDEEELAVKWYKKGVSEGNLESFTRMGRAYYYGRGVSEDEEMSLKFYSKIIDSEGKSVLSGEDERVIGHIYKEKSLLSDEYDQKVEMWLQKAVDHGDMYANILLGEHYLENERRRDVQKAQELFLNVYENCELKVFLADAERSLGYMYSNMYEFYYEDAEKSFMWMKRAAEHEDAFAQYLVGDSYHYGYGTEEDIEEAKQWYMKAAEQDVASAFCELGKIEQDAENYGDAFDLYYIGAEGGDAEAQYLAAVILYYGTSEIKCDRREARKLLEAAKEQGSSVAERFLEEHF